MTPREEVAAMRSSGLTYREIGERLGVSHERARQLLLPVPVRLCRCGCGQPVGRQVQYAAGHKPSAYVPRRRQPKPKMVRVCACGCGQMPPPRKRYRPECLARLRPPPQYHADRSDLAGQVIGGWEVIRRAGSVPTTNGAKAIYQCRCRACGELHEVRADNLRDRPDGSGCHRCSVQRPPEDLTGREFGGWRVLGPWRRSAPGRAQWLCRCECGREAWVQANNLVAGLSARCRSCAGKKVSG